MLRNTSPTVPRQPTRSLCYEIHHQLRHTMSANPIVVLRNTSPTVPHNVSQPDRCATKYITNCATQCQPTRSLCYEIHHQLCHTMSANPIVVLRNTSPTVPHNVSQPDRCATKYITNCATQCQPTRSLCYEIHHQLCHTMSANPIVAHEPIEIKVTGHSVRQSLELTAATAGIDTNNICCF